MSHIQECLSVFAVASWANTPESLDQAERAVGSYVSHYPESEELSALSALLEAFDSMGGDSTVANTIRDRIGERISGLSARSHRASDGPSANA